MHVLSVKAYLKHVFKCSVYTIRNKCLQSNSKPPWAIMFFGTDQFSLCSLKSLHYELKGGQYLNDLEVVTSIKTKNPVYNFAKNENLTIHDWPILLPNKRFDIGVVVSFGHLIPEAIINHFHFGILNVHASLLPRWRGAAPIIHAIANEDKETGVSIMRIQADRFDVGDLVAQRQVPLFVYETMPQLHERLARLGASVLVECLHGLPGCLQHACPQSRTHGVTYASKVTARMAHVTFAETPAHAVCALARALHTLYSLTATWNVRTVKLYEVSLQPVSIPDWNVVGRPGLVFYCRHSGLLCIQCSDGKFISVKRIGIVGKKPMTAVDFNNGYLKKETVPGILFK